MERFLPFLPGGPEAAEAAILISRDIEWLLTSDTEELWAIVRSDASLITFLESYLSGAPRPLDGFDDLSPMERSLWHQTLMLLERLFASRQQGVPSHSDRAKLLARLLTVPCLMDICSLYGAAAGQLQTTATSIINAMVSLRPALSSELASSAQLIAENLTQVVEVCASVAPAASRDPSALQSLADAVTYLRDACATLCALLRLYPAAAPLMLRGGPGLIEALGAVHDQLIPSAEAAAAAVGGAAGGGGGGGDANTNATLLRKRCLHVEVACERAVDLLIVHGYLLTASAAAAGGSSSSGAGSSSGISATSIAQGEALLNALTLLGHREGPQMICSGGGLALGPALAQRHGFGGAIQGAIQRGDISLDDAQIDYIAALMDVSSLSETPIEINPSSSSSSFNIGGGSSMAGGNIAGTNSSITSGTAAGGTAGGTAADTAAGTAGGTTTTSGGGDAAGDDAVLLSLVSQVRDLLPDFGEGFVAACLDAVGGSAERAINSLLEGALPAGLESLDTSMTFQTYLQSKPPKPSTSSSSSLINNSTGSTTQTGTQSQSQPSPSFTQQYYPSLGPQRTHTHPHTQQQNKPQPESMTAMYLDAREASYAEKLQISAAEAQWEYDDEYDDGQDEFLHLGADGLAEVEGDEEVVGSSGFSGGGGGSGGGVDGRMQGLSLGGGRGVGNNGGRGGQNRGEGKGEGRGASGDGANRGGRGQRGGRGGRQSGNKGRLWVHEGRVYNYSKPGAVEVSNEAEAQQKVADAQQVAQQIHGLGPGGNVPVYVQQRNQEEDKEQGEGGSGGGRGGGRGGGGDRGRGRGSHAHKDKNKAAIGNHHRKDRAAQKMNRAMQ